MKKIIIMVALFVAASLTTNAQSMVAKREHNNTLKAYFATKNALAKDNASQANETAKILAENIAVFPIKTLTAAQLAVWNVEAGTIQKMASTIATEKSIKEQRKSFWTLSSAMIKLTKSFNMNDEVVYVQYCPMAKKSWLNEAEAVQNPFYGSMMYDCGEITETLAKK
ncbi:DUF3347 domain-containing protein [Pedobacter insulae]|uniref:DUF3347 domain-containing protein n=1 Tax=Pedobacter insulae TaxID=414048 RepID=A0A1I2XGY8_9SPHI|nr:DUF3347 domain-containing protein [Pedobacter insulae]SFH11311.1 Protein of unknown function [Pedobacter insulae]